MQPIRRVRGIKNYEEHIDFYKFTQTKKVRREQPSSSPSFHQEQHFPYAKEAEVDSAEEFAKAVVAMLGAAARLKALLEEMGSTGGSSVLERRLVRSSDERCITGEAEPGAPVGVHTVHVRRLAASQLNRTAYFAPRSPTTIDKGQNRLRITADSYSRELEWFMLPEDTHQSALTRVKNIWNESGLPVKARLETDTATGRLRLTLESRETGASHAFFLQDLKGNTATATGLLVRDQVAADAHYRVNGERWNQSPVNRIADPEHKLVMNLSALPPAAVQLSVLPDYDLIRHKLNRLTAAFGQLEQELSASASYLDPLFYRILSRLKEQFLPELTADYLSYDLDLLLPRLTGKEGLVQLLSRFITRMESGPAEQLLNRSNSLYKRYANYLSSLEWYSQLPAQGLLLNRFL